MTKESPFAIEKNMIIIFGVFQIAQMMFRVTAMMVKVSHTTEKIIS